MTTTTTSKTTSNNVPTTAVHTINATTVSNKGKLIDYAHNGGITVVPDDYVIGKHKPLLMDDFNPVYNGVKNHYWFHVYKVQHLTWCKNVDIGLRVEYHEDCVASIANPALAKKLAAQRANAKEMKQRGCTKAELIVIKQKEIADLINNA